MPSFIKIFAYSCPAVSASIRLDFDYFSHAIGVGGINTKLCDIQIENLQDVCFKETIYLKLQFIKAVKSGQLAQIEVYMHLISKCRNITLYKKSIGKGTRNDKISLKNWKIMLKRH